MGADNWTTYGCLGRCLVEQQKWPEAAVAFAKAAAGVPRPPERLSADGTPFEVVTGHGLLQLRIGNEQAYRDACRSLLPAAEAATTVRAAWVLYLAPDAAAPGRLRRLAEQVANAIQRRPAWEEDDIDSPEAPPYPDLLIHRPPDTHWPFGTPNLRGAGLYRAGRYKEAVAALEAPATQQPAAPEDWLFLALAYAKAGRADDAKREFALADRLADKALKAPRDSGVTWDRQVGIFVLTREARSVLRAK